jgi:hypothetical protein
MGVPVDVLAIPGSTRLSQSTGHRRCARCGKVVSRRALFCRRCGKKQRVNPRTFMLLGAGVFLVALFAVATVGPRIPFLARLRGELMGTPAVATQAAPKLAAGPATGEPTMTAPELWAAYGADPAAADARWKGKPVSVTGTVVDARRDFRGKLIVRLATGDALETVHASVAVRDTDAHAMPARGQTVYLRCTGAGRAIGAPMLDACRPI